MHELAVTESILEITLRHAQAAGARRVTGLHILVGQLSSIIDDSVQFYWDIIARDSLAEGAELHFRRVPAELLCLACNHHYTPSDRDFLCPQCGSAQVKVVGGEEFQLEAIDVET